MTRTLKVNQRTVVRVTAETAKAARVLARRFVLDHPEVAVWRDAGQAEDSIHAGIVDTVGPPGGNGR